MLSTFEVAIYSCVLALIPLAIFSLMRSPTNRAPGAGNMAGCGRAAPGARC